MTLLLLQGMKLFWISRRDYTAIDGVWQTPPSWGIPSKFSAQTAFTGVTNNPTAIANSLFDGSNADLNNTGGLFQTFYGAAEVTNNTTFTIAGGVVNGIYHEKVTNGLKMQIVQTTGVYSLVSDGNWTDARLSESFILRADHNDTNDIVTIKYTITKSLSGNVGTAGLSNRLDIAYSDSVDGTTGTNYPSGTYGGNDYAPAIGVGKQYIGSNIITWDSDLDEWIVAPVSTTPGDYEWTQIKGDTGDGGISSRTDYAYADTITGTGNVQYPTGLYGNSTYASATPNTSNEYIGTRQVVWNVGGTEGPVSITNTDYIWTKYRGDEGVGGYSSRVDFAYGDTSNGATNTQFPSGLFTGSGPTAYVPATAATTNKYLGTNVVTWVTGQTEPAVSTVLTDYEWSQYTGDSGLATRLDFAYADNLDGSGNTQLPSGLRTNSTYVPATAADSNRFLGSNIVSWIMGAESEPAVSGTLTDYEWSLYTGVDALTILNSASSVALPSNPDGIVDSGDYGNSGTTISIYEGETKLSYDGAGISPATWYISAIAKC